MLTFALADGDWCIKGTVGELKGREEHMVDVARRDGTTVRRRIDRIEYVGGFEDTAEAIATIAPR